MKHVASPVGRAAPSAVVPHASIIMCGLHLLLSVVSAQDPTGTWTPNQHVSLGITCAKNAPNPNNPNAAHAGGYAIHA